MLRTAPAAMKAGGCSSAKMMLAALAAVGSAAISAARKGPLRSAATEATTTIVAVIAALSASPYQKNGSASIARADAESGAVELHLDRRTALARLLADPIAFRELDQLIELLLPPVRVA